MGSVRFTAAEWSTILLSLKVGAAAMLIVGPPGVLVGWLLSRKEFFGKSFVDCVVHLPLVLPPIVVGYVLLIVFGRNGVVGHWLERTLGLELAFTWKGAALAAAVVAFPLMVRAVRQAVDAVPTQLEDAAATLGAGRMRVFFTVLLPLVAPGIVAGLILSFARSLGEFGATIAFAGSLPGETRTLPLAIHQSLQLPGGESIAARLALISIALSLAALGGSEWMLRAFRARERRADARV